MDQQRASESKILLSLGSMCAAVWNSLAAPTKLPSFSSTSASRLCNSAVSFRASRS